MQTPNFLEEVAKLQAKPLDENLQRQVELVNKLRGAGVVREPSPPSPVDITAREATILWRF